MFWRKENRTNYLKCRFVKKQPRKDIICQFKRPNLLHCELLGLNVTLPPKVRIFSVYSHSLWLGAWAEGRGMGGWRDGAGEAVRGKVGSTLAQAIPLSPALRADRITATPFFRGNWNSSISPLFYRGCICLGKSGKMQWYLGFLFCSCSILLLFSIKRWHFPYFDCRIKYYLVFILTEDLHIVLLYSKEKMATYSFEKKNSVKLHIVCEITHCV